MDTRNYYQKQLDVIGEDASFKFMCLTSHTNWLNLNKESATTLIEKLIDLYGPEILPNQTGVDKNANQT